MGMDISKVKQNILRMNGQIEAENKIKYLLEQLPDQLNKSYSSENATRLHSIHSEIIESTHIKNKNLKSYQSYTEKYVSKYSAVNQYAVEKSVEMREQVS